MKLIFVHLDNSIDSVWIENFRRRGPFMYFTKDGVERELNKWGFDRIYLKTGGKYKLIWTIHEPKYIAIAKSIFYRLKMFWRGV